MEFLQAILTSNFSFSHSVCYQFGELHAIFTKFEIIVCKLFQVGRSLKFVIWERVNSLPNNKILDLSKLKASTEITSNATQNLKLVLERVDNIVVKGGNAGYKHFLLFPQSFQKPPFFRVV